MTFTESDFEYLQLTKCDKTVVNEFFKTINNETLGKKVSDAINQKQQGHFNKAMLKIAEVNRDQVLAVREIQAIFDELKGSQKTEVILDKFRQKHPFQIGLTNGEEVLTLLSQVKSFFDEDFSNIINELRQNEEKADSLNAELNFFEERMHGKISEQELDELRNNISLLFESIVSTKKLIIKNLDNFLQKEYDTTNPNVIIKLIQNFFVILTSSIETLDAEQVVL